MKEQINKKAEELYHKYWDDAGEYTAPWSLVSVQYKDRWRRLAKDAMEKELEARIQEISPYILFGGVSEKISRLHNQLQQLRGGE